VVARQVDAPGTRARPAHVRHHVALPVRIHRAHRLERDEDDVAPSGGRRAQGARLRRIAGALDGREVEDEAGARRDAIAPEPGEQRLDVGAGEHEAGRALEPVGVDANAEEVPVDEPGEHERRERRCEPGDREEDELDPAAEPRDEAGREEIDGDGQHHPDEHAPQLRRTEVEGDR